MATHAGRPTAGQRASLGAHFGRAGSRTLILYLDSSALVKRYVAEPDSEVVIDAMDSAERRVASRVAYVEVLRAVALAAGSESAAARRFLSEWSSLDVIEIDAQVTASAAQLAIDEGLRTLDALHLASALCLPRSDVVVATWDRRLAAAARTRGLAVLPSPLG